MSASCCDHALDPHRGNEGYRRVLWVVLAINAVMFAVEVAAGIAAGSASLRAAARFGGRPFAILGDGHSGGGSLKRESPR